MRHDRYYTDPISSLCTPNLRRKLRLIVRASKRGTNAGEGIGEIQYLQELIEVAIEERHAAVSSIFG